MIGKSPALQRVRDMIGRVAPSDARVLITGESGTGKELVAAAIHAGGARKDRPFIRVNCAAIPRDLVESEMFGHERGAFTNATERRIGRFELADRGTLLLDEVGDLGAEAQAKLLRAIESGEIERVGGGKPIRIDVRIVSATNKDLTRAVEDGTFREDLFFRLNVIPLAIPPLRERPDDIPALVRHFSALHRGRTGQPLTSWTADALDALARYRWPGNIRELANIVERLAILYPGREVTSDDVKDVLPIASARFAEPHVPPNAAGLDASLTDTLDDYERILITRALSVAAGNIAEAARRLQTDRPNLYRRMKRLGIVESDRGDRSERAETPSSSPSESRRA
jgi:two-component system nitrogen regulation response regulator NtrX